MTYLSIPIVSYLTYNSFCINRLITHAFLPLSMLRDVVRFSERSLLLELLSSLLLLTLQQESPPVSLFSELSETEPLTLRELLTVLIRPVRLTLPTPSTET